MRALKKMFRDEIPDKWFGTVQKRLSPGRWVIEDLYGRFREADSDEFLRPGDSVCVQTGRIVGPAASTINVKTIEV